MIGATFPARMQPPREALQPVCSRCRGPVVREAGDVCPACEIKQSLKAHRIAADHSTQTSLGDGF